MNNPPASMAQSQAPANNPVVDTIWQIYKQNINSGACQHIEMPMNLKSVVGEKGLEIIAFRYRILIQAPVTTFEDHDRGVIQIMPSRNDHGHDAIILGACEPKVKASRKAKVARPPNAFILYRQYHHPILKSTNPDMHNNQISVILGAQWKNELQTTKTHFINLAKKMKAKHFYDHPNYQYQPRKPSEKKRRMTRRKKAALTETSNAEPSSSTSFAVETPSAGDEVSCPVSELAMGLGGNAMLELGDEDLDDEMLSAMLEQYNYSRPQANNHIGGIVAQSSPPVIYGELTADAQDQKNFYSNMHEFCPFMSNEEFAANMDATLEGTNGFKEVQAAMLDPDLCKINSALDPESFFDAELNRMCHWDEEHSFPPSPPHQLGRLVSNDFLFSV